MHLIEPSLNYCLLSDWNFPRAHFWTASEPAANSPGPTSEIAILLQVPSSVCRRRLRSHPPQLRTWYTGVPRRAFYVLNFVNFGVPSNVVRDSGLDYMKRDGAGS